MSRRHLGLQPERCGAQVADLLEASEGGATLSLDATERLLQRPVNEEKQKEKYSGKRKTHTDKNLLLVNENTKKVVYLSEMVAGKMHDKKLADQSKISYPNNASLTQDTGFQGYHPPGVVVQQPKKVRKQGLTQGARFLNKGMASVRIMVENVISGVKRCRLVKDELRFTKEHLSDVVMEIACGLHNLRVTFRQPMQTIDLTDFAAAPYFL